MRLKQRLRSPKLGYGCPVGSQPGCLKGVTGTGVAIVRPRSKRSKVAPQRFQCVPLLIDFTHRAHTAPSEERDRWAPALKGMLKQESRDDDRHREEMPRTLPVSASVAAFASKVRSMSHSSSSSWRRRSMRSGCRECQRTLPAISSRIAAVHWFAGVGGHALWGGGEHG